MLFNYNGDSRISGIYEIRNRHTNRSYIGQTQSFKKRWNDHRNSLLTSKYQNKYLKNDFNKCYEELGHDNFIEFHIIEVMENSIKEDRNTKEEFWIKTYEENGYKLYNFMKEASSKKRSCYSNTPEETYNKKSKARKGKSYKEIFGEEKAEEVREKISKAHQGKILSPEHLQKIKENAAKTSGVNHPMFGKENKWGTHTSESIEKIRISSTGRERSKNTLEKVSGINHWTKKTGGHSKETKKKISVAQKHKMIPIKAINLITKEEINFESISCAAKHLNIFKPNIKAVLKGKYKKTHNFTFSYL